jgi:hypothetical protein
MAPVPRLFSKSPGPVSTSGLTSSAPQGYARNAYFPRLESHQSVALLGYRPGRNPPRHRAGGNHVCCSAREVNAHMRRRLRLAFKVSGVPTLPA